MFTPEELAEIAAADAEIERTFNLTAKDIQESKQWDREALNDRKDWKAQMEMRQRKKYYAAKKEILSARRREKQGRNAAQHKKSQNTRQKKLRPIGALVKKRREREGLRQVDVAKRLGVSSHTISAWETGERLPSFELLEGIFPGLTDAAANELLKLQKK